jgi:hypothetical protein
MMFYELLSQQKRSFLFFASVLIWISGCSDGPAKDGFTAPPSQLDLSKVELSGTPFDLSASFSGLCNYKSKTSGVELKDGRFTFEQTTVLGRPTLVISCADLTNTANKVEIYINNFEIEDNVLTSENGFRGQIGQKALMGNIPYEGYYYLFKARLTSDTAMIMSIKGSYGYTQVLEVFGELNR